MAGERKAISEEKLDDQGLEQRNCAVEGLDRSVGQAEYGALAAVAFEGPHARWAARAFRVWAFPDRVPRPGGAARPAGRMLELRERLGDAADAGEGWAQVWDIPPIELEKVPWLRPQAALRVLRVLREDDHRRSAVRPARPGLLRA